MTRSLADRIETQPRPGNGSVAGPADFLAPMTSESADSIGAPAAAPGDAITGLKGQLIRLTQQVTELHQRNEQLRAVVDKRTRRVQQLIGERDRLTALLAGRDAELQRLNRELGALGARGQAGQARSSSLLASTQKLLDRLHRARGIAGRPKVTTPPPPRADVGGNEGRLIPWQKHRPPKDVIAVVVFGLSEAEIDRVLQAVEPYCAGQGIAPLLLTDTDAFQVFRGRRALCEFLPAPSDQERLAPELDWRLYTLRRLALIRRKWQPLRVVAFGHRAVEVVKLWRDSPFERTSIPAALNASSGVELHGTWRSQR